jgi:uracil-DNA glycosylase family 4
VTTLYRQVQGYGSLNPKIVIIGEAPADEEVKQGIPFVGPSGKVLRREIKNAKLNEAEIRFENLCEHKAPNNKIEQVPKEELQLWKDDLKERIKRLNPAAVVTCGNVPTNCFLPNTKISEQHCYLSELRPGGPVLIPSYHPSYVIRGNWKDAFWIRLALSKAKTIANREALADHKHDITIAPSYDDIIDWLSGEDVNTCQFLACDIEKTQTNEISCISFACAPDKAISIPFIIDGQSYWNLEQEKKIWKLIDIVLSHNSPKVFHNFIFDVLVLSYFGVEVNGEIHDTMTLAHLLHPELKKGLADIGRLHTWGPEWKSKGEWKHVKDWEQFWAYNAMDSARTLECFFKQKALLEACGRWSLYRDLLQPLTKPVYQMCAQGWRLDHEGIANEKVEVEALMSELNAKIDTYANQVNIEHVNPGSPVQLKDFAKAMGWKVPTKMGRETMDKTARAKLYIKYKHPALRLVDEYKELDRYVSSYLNVKLDEDKKFRFQITIPGTIEGRFSSEKSPMGTGGNSQNIPKRFRKFVIADNGCILINTDLERADARVVGWLSQDPMMNKIFEQRLDMHTITANSIFGMDIMTLPKDEYEKKRALGKKANHALNYGMQARRFMEDVLKDTGINISLEEAQQIIDGYFRTYPGIIAWHQSIQAQIRQTRKLVSPHGRVRTFLGIIDDTMFREAYAWIPPTAVADSIDTTMLTFIWACQQAAVDAKVLGQTHDSLLIQVPEKDLKETIQIIDFAMKKSVFYVHGKPCCLGHDIMVGYRWGQLKSYEEYKK